MRKMGLFWFAAALLGAALIFAGCENPASSDGAAGAPGAIYLSGPQSSAGIKDALDSGAPVVFAGVTQSDTGVVVIEAGKAVKLVGPAAYTPASTGTLLLRAASSVTGNGFIDASAGTVIGPADVAAKVSGALVAFQEGDSPITFPGGIAAVLGDVTVGAGTGELSVATLAGNTLYVIGDLTVSAEIPSANAPKFYVLGDATVSVEAKGAAVWDVSGTLTASKAPTTTGAITANALNVTATTGTTALNTATGAINIGAGGVTTAAGAVTFGGAATFTGPATFGGTANFNGAATFAGTAVFSDDVTLTAVTAAFSNTAFFKAEKKITLTAAASIIKLGPGAGLAVGTPSPNAPDVYATVIRNSGANDLTLTPDAAIALTFSTTGRGITQSGDASHNITIAGGTAALPAGATYTVVSTSSSVVGKLTIASGATLDLAAGVLSPPPPGEPGVNGVSELILNAGSSLALGGGVGITGAKLKGGGGVKAGATTITGEWQAVTTSGSAANITIKATISETVKASITGDANNVLTAGAGGVITQGVGTGNELSLEANTTIDLGGTATDALGKIVLKGASADAGVIKLAATSSIVKTGLSAGTSAFATAAKIGGAAFGSSSDATITTTGDGVAGKFAKLTATATNNTLIGGGADTDITIDSTQEVTT